MNKVFVLQNQQKLFLSKHHTWVDGRDTSILFKTALKDEAVNQMVETSAKDYTQRVHLLDCLLNHRNHPLIAAEDLPEPQETLPPGEVSAT